ncbi:MAG: class I SAM-dependent methyltransferase [Euzebyales bacterium]|nr:class I SAM-dependent methyltransferase [Euzebyales bacterium]MBA3621248.1 class I SAM-dependent methyltransferase [Euzebyales bacterium]
MAGKRTSLTHQLRYAVSHPERVRPHVERLARDVWLRLRTRDHVAYYREVMRHDVARSPTRAVGSRNEQRWMAIGKLQYDYLLSHGLQPADRMLEIGCGNLRAGWRFISYLEPGHYYGVDISPDVLFAAQETITRFGLQDRLPTLTPVRDLKLGFLPPQHFTVIHAHSVFSHSPLDVMDECFTHVGRILHPDGFFDFTFNATEGAEHQVLREDFYYRPATLIGLAGRHGLKATLQQDWRTGNTHKQDKIRLTH